uniref:Uncharacterized protein n=1 Tax=Anguilla anguilla TaxID=7936 RepID=A0A0E9PYT1_ANGAN
MILPDIGLQQFRNQTGGDGCGPGCQGIRISKMCNSTRLC